MAQDPDLRALTLRYFESINFSELNHELIAEVIDSEFTDVQENEMRLDILFADDDLRTLNKLAEICSAWCEQPAKGNSVEESNASEGIVLWTVLDEVGIKPKQILVFIYLLCDTAKRSFTSETSEHSSDEKAYGLAGAKLYFNCLRIPGSSAYKVYHPNLFCLCIDCLFAPDLTVDKDNVALRELEEHSALYISTLASLIPLLKEFHLGNETDTIDHVMTKLVELAGCELHNHIKFDQNLLELGERELRRRYKITFVISSLAYQAFQSILETDLNFDKNRNYNYILYYLSQYILCLKARNSSTISQKHLLVKDNAVAFICHTLNNPELNPAVVKMALKRLCRGSCDKVDFRTTVSQAVVNILLHMKSEDIADMIQGCFLLFVDSSDAKDRTTALEILSLLLKSKYGNDLDTVSDSLKPYLAQTPVVFSILTRCDDFSPVVRRKALYVLSDNIKVIFEFFEKTKEQDTFECEKLLNKEAKNFDEEDLDFNGNHRFFWYKLKTFKRRLNEIACILQRRVEDFNCVNRVAALLALGNLVMFHSDFLTEENLKLFRNAMKDENVSVRKQLIDSLTGILATYRNSAATQECWLKCILPFVQDPENSVITKALSVLENQFLQRIYSSDELDIECSFALLKRMCIDFLAHQRYLQKAFHQWKADNKLNFVAQKLVRLERYIETEWQESVWFLISIFAAHCSLPSRIYDIAVEQLEKFQSHCSYRLGVTYMLKVLNCVLPNLSDRKLEIVQNIMRESLESLNTPVQIIPEYIEILSKVHKIFLTENEFSEFISTLFKKCEKELSEIKSSTSFPIRPSEELLAKYFCIIKELCSINSAFITEPIISLLKTFSGCGRVTAALSRLLTPTIKAHAYAALGKLCLQDEILAKGLLTVYAKELLSSKHDVIRNNIVIILLEMCKRYTSAADRYVPIISLCFKDKLYLIRYQTILLVVNLVQEGYIKWKGALFFCLVSTLVDEKEDIRELGYYSLTQLLQDKKKNVFSEHFIDSIFVFNSFPPPDNNSVAKIVKELDRFSLKGESKRPKRLVLYKFLLESMDDKEKAYLVKSICEILTNIAENVYPVSEITECMIGDCFAILNSKELHSFGAEKLSNIIDKVEEETEEEQVCHLIKGLRKIIVIEPVIPVIVSLKNSIINPKLDLMNDIIHFLKEMLSDYRDELKEILAIDVILLRQLELEFASDAEKERLKAKGKNKKDGVTPADEPEADHNAIDNIKSLLERTNLSIPVEKDKKGEKSASNQLMPNGLQTRAIVHRADKSNTSPGSTNSDSSVASAASPEKGRKGKKSASPNQETPNISAAKRRRNRRANKNNTSPNSSSSNSSITYNIVSATPAEAKDLHRFASTPRVVLTAVKVPPSSSVLNLSAIERPTEPMIVEDSDENI